MLIPLHGAAGSWDELVCLVLPATALMGLALAVLRPGQVRDAEPGPVPLPEGTDDRPAAGRGVERPREDDSTEEG